MARFERARTNPGGLDYKQWCRKLLGHYFVAAPNDPTYRQPVRYLSVTEQDLQQASALATPEEARASLLDVFQREVRDRPFQTAYRAAPRLDLCEVPDVVVPVVVSSLAAAEYTSEDRYRATFNELCANGRENDTKTLPELWEQLRDWLKACRASDDPLFSVRELVLPPRPDFGWRNIFYPRSLTFPGRRDREELQEALVELVESPTVAEVLGVVERRTSRFSDLFQEYLNDFRRRTTHSPLHPFWYAVQTAWQGLRREAEAAVQVRLWAQVISNVAHVYLLTDSQQDAPVGCSAKFVPTLSAFVVVDKDGHHEGPVLDLLAGKLQLGRLSRDAENGVIALQSCGPRMFDSRGGVPRSGHGIALVRASRVMQFRESLAAQGGSAGSVAGQYAPNWELVTDLVFNSATDETMPLSSARAFVSMVRGTGIAYADGYLSVPGFSPLIASEHAARVDARLNDGSPPIAMNGDGGIWSLPNAATQGTWTVTARDEGGDVLGEVVVRFVDPPSQSEYKIPTAAQCERMRIEGCEQDLDALQPELPCLSDSSGELVPEGAVYLGPVVGAWSKAPEVGYDWLADRRTKTLRFLGDPDAPTPPVAKVLSKSAARFWRECFGPRFSLLNATDATSGVLKAYRAMARAQRLPRGESTLQRPLLEVTRPPPSASSVGGVDLFSTVLGTLAMSQSGLDEAEVFQIIDRAFGQLDWRLKWLVLRSWVEAGALELALDQRWPARRYFCRRPRLIFRDSSRVEAVIVGTLLPSVANRVIDRLASKGGRAYFGASTSPYAPRLLHVSGVGNELETLLRQEHFAESATAEDPRGAVTSVQAIVDPERCPDPDEWKDREGRVWSWDEGYFARSADVGRVMLRLVQEPRRPDRYEVVIDGRAQWWTYSRTWAFLSAYDAMSRSPFSLADGTISVIERSGAQLPVRLAQTLAISTGVTAGPDAVGRYGYFTGTDTLASDLMRRLLPSISKRETNRA